MAITNKELYEALSDIRKELESDYKDLDRKIEKTYLRVVQFIPVRNVVYGMVGMILTAFFGGVIALIIK